MAEPTPDNQPAHLREDLKWKPGQSGNPKGRPKGSRNKLGEAFLEDMMASWQKHGTEAIERVIEERPQDYLKVIASILPKELNVNLSPIEQMNDDELIHRIRELSEVIGPFLSPEGIRALDGGASQEAKH